MHYELLIANKLFGNVALSSGTIEHSNIFVSGMTSFDVCFLLVLCIRFPFIASVTVGTLYKASVSLAFSL